MADYFELQYITGHLWAKNSLYKSTLMFLD